MSSISSGTTLTTALVQTADTSGVLQLQSNGTTTAITVDISQNVGIGVTPSAWGSSYKAVQMPYATMMNSSSGGYYGANFYYNSSGSPTYVNNGYALAYSAYSAAGAHLWLTAPSGTAGNAITFTQAMTLDASGRLLNGATSAYDVYVVQGSIQNNTLSSAIGFVYNGINANSTEPNGARIIYSGGAPNDVNHNFYTGSDTGATRFAVRGNGGIANYSANNVNLSDRREKTNFAPAKSYIDVICAIPVQTYNYIDQNLEKDDGLSLGVVAQDVQEVAPELVTESNWGSEAEPKMRLSIYQTDLQYALMKCIQEQQAMIITLQSQVTALQSKG